MYDYQLKVMFWAFGIVFGGIVLLSFAILFFRWHKNRKERQLRDRMLQVLDNRPINEVLNVLRDAGLVNGFSFNIYEALYGKKYSPKILGRAISSVVNEVMKEESPGVVDCLAQPLARVSCRESKGAKKVTAFLEGFKSRRHEKATQALDAAFKKALEEEKAIRARGVEDRKIQAGLKACGYKKKVDLSGPTL